MTKEMALERLRYKCSRAEYCSGQVAAILRKWIVSDDSHSTIQHIIEILIAEGFINDSRFANAFVRDKLKFNGWGRQKIVYKLKSFGIAPHIIQRALEMNYDIEGGDTVSGYQVLEKLLKKKMESLKKEESFEVRKAKAIRFALGRGFEYDAIVVAMEKIKE